MKHFKTLFLSLSLLTVAVAFSSCSSNAEATDKQGKEYTSAYVCPMHCKDSGSDKAGTCPACKMAYVKNEDYKGTTTETGHEGHDHSHEGHDHSHDGHDHSHDGHDHSGHNH